MKKRLKQIIVCLVMILIFALVWYLAHEKVMSDNQDRINEYLISELKNYESRVEATIASYETFSNYVYEEVINSEDVLKIMYKINGASDELMDTSRLELYELLNDKYKTMTQYEFRQLHFHLPNNESFLRFHFPKKYGDDLSEVRKSVAMANIEHSYVSGFEEGRIFNGYRYVYPLIYLNKYIGSVEVSVSPSSVLHTFSSIYGSRNSYFIIKKEIVDNKVFDEVQDNYKTSIFNDKYYVDGEVEMESKMNNHLFNSADELVFIYEVSEELVIGIDSEESFNLLKRYKGTDYLIQFFSIRNILDEPVAYFIEIIPNEQIKILNMSMDHTMIFVTIIIVLIVVMLFLVYKNFKRLKLTSNYDYLTGIYNRSKFDELLYREFNRSIRYRYTFSLLMFDVDYFKLINDRYGHSRGDEVLKDIALIVGEELRVNDIFARWGGEEFICLLPFTDIENGLIVGEKLRRLIQESEILSHEKVTISVGVTDTQFKCHSVNELIEKVDKALYRAKNSGRNRVCK